MAGADNDTDVVEKKKGRTGRTKGTSSKNGSRTNSPANTNKEIEAWDCNMCSITFSKPNDKLLECQRCKEHFCIKCLKKSEEEYKWLSKSDTMWFCVPCREKVERNIVIDREIEDRCRDMAANFEKRIKTIEDKLEQKCEKGEVRDIVTQEIDKKLDKQVTAQGAEANKEQENNVDSVITELNERKRRENNLVVYGVEELNSGVREERWNFDNEQVLEIAKVCETDIVETDISKVVRLGKFNKDKLKSKRPILVTLHNKDKKPSFFKGARKLKEHEKHNEVRLANDLTHNEMENERKLNEEAKDMTKNCQDHYQYRVRGPPWARKIVRTKQM